MKKYILFGAGNIGRCALQFLGQEQVEGFIDNNRHLAGKMIEDIKVHHFNDSKSFLEQCNIVICVNENIAPEIEQQLIANGYQYILFKDLRKQILRQRIENRPDFISVYKRSEKWIFTHTIDKEGIICHTGLKKSYPEVSGYYIPTLLKWGYRDLALQYAKWLCRIQKADGSWYDVDDRQPYIFDSAQILKGLIAIRNILPEVDTNIRKGCRWILSYMQSDGRLISPRKNDFGDGKTFHEVIHLYCLSPLVEAAQIFNEPVYMEAALKILGYYKQHHFEKIMNFELLSHFYAYVMEALLDMGEEQMVKKAMDCIAEIQREDGSVPGYQDVEWICSTGLFQLALVWFRLGDMDHGNRAFTYACKLQNTSGGWYGGYGPGEENSEKPLYFANDEISWANKYFMDALYYKNKAEFELQAHIFKNTLSDEDGRYKYVESKVREAVTHHGGIRRILDLGCGKGAYLKNLRERVKDAKYYAVDISDTVMQYIRDEEIEHRQGTLTNIPYPDNYFDVTYTCEALEHAIAIASAIREMARVTVPGGTILVIDKNKSQLGEMEIGEWEQWFDETELKEILQLYCEDVKVEKKISYEKEEYGLFYAWMGVVK